MSTHRRSFRTVLGALCVLSLLTTAPAATAAKGSVFVGVGPGGACAGAYAEDTGISHCATGGVPAPVGEASLVDEAWEMAVWAENETWMLAVWAADEGWTHAAWSANETWALADQALDDGWALVQDPFDQPWKPVTDAADAGRDTATEGRDRAIGTVVEGQDHVVRLSSEAATRAMDLVNELS